MAHDSNEADRERAAIVAKYDKGREEGAEIDPWEDADFFIYKVTDRYGFLHKEPLASRTDLERKAMLIERSREIKWIKMLNNWDKALQTDKLRSRVYKGIPNSLRSRAWGQMLRLDKLKSAKEGFYDEAKQLARLTSPDIKQIDLDVNRTYRNHIMFRERYGVKQQALFHVLATYSMYNTEVGYCQGMSGIAALLLMYFNEEDAFWALSSLLSDRMHGMHGLFKPGFPKLLRLQEHHEKICKKLLTKLHKHLKKIEVDARIYSMKWFLQCFLDRLPFSLTLRVWDAFMFDGDRVPIAMAFLVIKLNKKQLSKMTFDEAMGHLQTMESHDFNDDEVMESLQSTMTELRRSGLDHPGPSQTTEQAPPPPRDIDELRSRVLFSQRIHDVNYKPSRIKRNESFREGIKAMYDNDDEPITSPNTSEPDNTDDRIYHNVQDNHSTIIPKVPAKSSGSPLRSTSYGLGNPTDANGHVPVSV